MSMWKIPPTKKKPSTNSRNSLMTLSIQQSLVAVATAVVTSTACQIIRSRWSKWKSTKINGKSASTLRDDKWSCLHQSIQTGNLMLGETIIPLMFCQNCQKGFLGYDIKNP